MACSVSCLCCCCLCVVQTQTAALTKDTWHLLLDFSLNISPDLSNFDEDGGCRPAPRARSLSVLGPQPRLQMQSHMCMPAHTRALHAYSAGWLLALVPLLRARLTGVLPPALVSRTHPMTGAWPLMIDDFVSFARKALVTAGGGASGSAISAK
jgi:hypothetical protein